MARGKRVAFAADFETTTDPEDCRVWLWGIAPVEEPTAQAWGTSLDSFIHKISKASSVVSFHNLKFDGTFIIDWLLKHDYEHFEGDYAGEPGSFKTLISDMGKFYSFTVYWVSGNITEFRDSVKKIPMPVARAAEAFKLDRLKGELDYHKLRPIGYKPTREELEYLYNDVYIVAEILRQITDEGMTRLTVASDSMAEYKSLITTKRFNTLFPVLSLGMDREIRRAYRGGFAYADKRHQMKRTGSGIVLDVNSLYPHIMYTKALPYGMPEYFNGEPQPTETHSLTTFTVTFTARLKKHHLPCIQVKGSLNFGATEYLSVIDEPTTLTVTNVDWELWNKHYDITPIEWSGGWRFRAAHDLFKEYIEKWSKIKAESTGGKREIAKLHLNSLYGRFAANPNVTGKVPYIKDSIVRYSPGQEETRNPVYTAMAAFITAYARELTINAAQANYDTFAYADTDSLHLLTDEIPEGIDVDPHRMGAWKREYGFSEALYVRAKFYLERVTEAHNGLETGDVMVKVAGLPEAVTSEMSFPDVYDGNVLTGKLQPRNVPGGVVLVDTDFTIKL